MSLVLLSTTFSQLLAYTCFLLVVLVVTIIIAHLLKADQSDFQTAYRYVQESTGDLSAMQRFLSQDETNLEAICDLAQQIARRVEISGRILTQIIYENGDVDGVVSAKNSLGCIEEKMLMLYELLHIKDYKSMPNLLSEIIIDFNKYQENLQSGENTISERKLPKATLASSIAVFKIKNESKTNH